MRRYTRRPCEAQLRANRLHRADDDDLGYEQPYHHVEVSGERQPYWCGLYDHRGDEIWVTERRQLGFVQEEDDDDDQNG